MIEDHNKIALPQSFFARPAPEVAPDLLGKYLVRRFNNQECACLITETEAYEGTEDLASHASRGRTARTEVMFGPAGRLYVYLIYGMHHMLNVVTHEEGQPSAVLIRALNTVSGPGRLTKALDINRDLNARTASESNGLWFEDRGIMVGRNSIERSARIGVDYAGPLWSQKPWRFVWTEQV